MSEFIFFVIGLLLGGVIGVGAMCLAQINRMSNCNTPDREVEPYEKKNR